MSDEIWAPLGRLDGPALLQRQVERFFAENKWKTDLLDAVVGSDDVFLIEREEYAHVLQDIINFGRIVERSDFGSTSVRVVALTQGRQLCRVRTCSRSGHGFASGL